MANTSVIQTFTRGYNGDASPFVLDATQVSNVQNMLFERGLLISRPPLYTFPWNSIAGIPYSGVMDGPYYPSGSDMYGFVRSFDTPNWKLWKINRRAWDANFMTQVQVTLPAGYVGLTGGYPFGVYIDHITFQSSALITGFQTGGGLPAIVAIASNGAGAVTGITLPTTVGYFPTITTHLSRVLAATLMGNQIAWSKIGDATTWTGHFTTGSVNLDDIDDGITGLGIARNAVVVARTQGFHLGFATGNGQNPYDWKKFSGRRSSPGCWWPRTFVQYRDSFFYVSDTNVHKFDLNQVTDIGEGITAELFGLASLSDVDMYAFITNTYKTGYRPQYHVCVQGYSLSSVFKHFVYDITEGLWSRHVYDNLVADAIGPAGVAFVYQTTNPRFETSAPALIRRSTSSLLIWFGSGCESAQTFTTGRMQLGEAHEESKLVRLLVVAYCSTNSTTCSATFNSLLGNATTNSSVNFTLNSGWQRVWVNKIQVGQFFTITINIPAGVYVEFRQLTVMHEASGQELRV